MNRMSGPPACLNFHCRQRFAGLRIYRAKRRQIAAGQGASAPQREPCCYRLWKEMFVLFLGLLAGFLVYRFQRARDLCKALMHLRYIPPQH